MPSIHRFIEDVPLPPRGLPRWFFVRRYQALSFVVALMTSISLLGSALFIAIAGEWPSTVDWTLDRHHVKTEGDILGLRQLSHIHINGQSPWEVRFEYATGQGQRVEAVGYTTDEAFKGKAAGQPLSVEYDPENPTIARPAGGSRTLLPLWVFLIPLIPLLIASVLWVVLGVVVHRAKSLLQDGTAVEGRVTDIRVRRHIHFGARHPYDVHYTFCDPLGESSSGVCRTYRYAWAESLKSNSPVIIIYDPMNPRRNTLWVGQGDEGTA